MQPDEEIMGMLVRINPEVAAQELLRYKAENEELTQSVFDLKAEKVKLEHTERSYEEENDQLKEDNDNLIKQLEEGIKHINAPCADALDKLWRDIMPPNYGDWEYAGMAYRHLLCMYREQSDKIFDLEEEIKKRDEQDYDDYLDGKERGELPDDLD